MRRFLEEDEIRGGLCLAGKQTVDPPSAMAQSSSRRRVAPPDL
jgi:hypothetical protein